MRAVRTVRARKLHVVAVGLAFAGAVLAWCPSAFALNPALEISQYAHTAWKNREGFAKGTIRAIAQTPDGYLWLGTELGLLRFDGIRAVPWQPPADRPLPSTDIWSLLVARDGTLWIGTSKGLASWKGGTLTRVPELSGRIITTLLEDREGMVWASGISVPRGTVCAIRGGAVSCYGEDGAFGYGVLTFYEDRKGNLWAGGGDDVWRLRPGSRTGFPLPRGAINARAFAEDLDGALLIVTGSGLLRFADGRYETVPLSVPERQLQRILRDRDGALWVATSNALVHMYRERTDVFARENGFSGSSTSALFEDREGNVWVGHANGLERFREFAVSTLAEDHGVGDVVLSVVAEGTGTVWIGTNDGLRKWNQGHVSGSSGRSVGLLFRDDRGRVWAQTPGAFGYFEDDRYVSTPSLPVRAPRSMVQDTQGNLWVTDQALGLLRLAPGGEVTRFPWDTLGHKDFATALIGDRVRGGVWLGFWDGGIAYFKDGRIRETYAARDGLGEGRVNGFYGDAAGSLWIATEGGLSRLRNDRTSTLTIRNGLPCDTVHWVIEDDNQYLWLNTVCGLVRMARAEVEAWTADQKRSVNSMILDNSDGVTLQAISVGYDPHVAKAADGRLWFVGQTGVQVVDPRHLPFNNLSPPVRIEQVTADHRTYDTSSYLRLPPLVRDVEIDYTALSLVAPEKNRFRYKLEGFDRDWQDVGNRRLAYYTNLPPRTYRFRVIASNNSGVWNETGAALDFSIAPAYFQTAWFRALAAAALASLLWAAHRLRLRIVERHEAEISALNERLIKAQEQERIRIAGELHDGVMQQISALSLMLGTARRQIPSELEAKAAVGEVQRKLIQVGADVRHLSHDLHPAMLKEAGLPEALRGYCEEFSRARGIAVTCDADDNVRELSRGAALALYRIAQEALGNAATHGAAQHAAVRVTRSNGYVILSVSDDGKGFESSRIASGGLGLLNMRERARQLNGTFDVDSAPRRGTTVRVTIPFRRAL
jgi:signal transduction histidine kinase/ligand-binding sensor domain-containing protein